MMNFSEIMKHPKLSAYSFINRRLRSYLSDKEYLKILYYLRTGATLNLRHPSGYREKIQWLKLYDRNPRYTMLVDKFLVKDYVAKLIGSEHIVKTLFVWDNPESVEFEKLPEQFVLKCNHNSHLGLCICADKSTFDFEKARKELRRGYYDDYYKRSREWAYKNVERKIIAEEFLSDGSANDECVLTDYKYFCFDGKAKMMYISKDISKDPRTDFFDMDYNHLPIYMQDKNADELPPRPAFFDEMRRDAETLSKGIPFVRVDFYIANNRYYFGEMTFYPSSGLAEMHPKTWDKIIGDWIKLPSKRGKQL